MGKTWRKERSDWDDHHSKKGFVKRKKNFWREELKKEIFKEHEGYDDIENINSDKEVVYDRIYK